MKLTINQDPRAKDKMKSYPPKIKSKLNNLRKLILETASEIDSISEIEETLKWGELSYLSKKGSTIRMDWKEKKPEQYAMYFKCTSKLVVSFKEVYGNLFNYETTRAIVFKFDEEVPKEAMKSCIAAALQYHDVKNEPLLGLTTC